LLTTGGASSPHVRHHLASGRGQDHVDGKLLLYGGAVQLAGSVTARKNQRATTSDWMELEKKRGISISSTVLQFEYDGYRSTCSTRPATRISPRTPIACSPRWMRW
jgi:hypothetical protein